MADFSALKQSIQNYIKQNGNKEITGNLLQTILLSMVTTMGDGAINDNASDISDIKGDIQNINGDITNINSSITDINGDITDINGDITELNGNLSNEVNRAKGAETTTLLFSDGKLVFKNAAGTVLYQLSVDSFLSAITTRLNTGALYAGFATPSTTPAALTGQEVFYLATQAGTYTNFHFNGGDEPIVLTKDGIYFIVSGTDDDDWNAEPMLQLDDVPTASSNNAVKSGGVAEELALGAIYDVSAKNPTAGPNNDGKWESLSALFSDANLSTLIPASVRKGGMSIKFVQSSDNKYVRYHLLANSFTTDTTQWAIDDAGVYVENPEFVYVKTDAEGKILWAIKTDGDIYYGAGVPQQVIDYIEEKIAALSLDEYEDIVAFLSDYLGSDTTLKAMIDGINAQIESLDGAKVDKEEGKSLIDAEYAEGVYHTENPEWMYVILDNENHILGGIKVDGHVEWSKGVPTPVKAYIGIQIANSIAIERTRAEGAEQTLSGAIALKVDKVTGKSLIDADYANNVSYIDSDEYIYVLLDNQNHILEAITTTGEYINNLSNNGNITNASTAIPKSAGEYSLGHSELDNLQYDYNVLIIDGQSLSVGSETSVARQTVGNDYCFMLGNNIWVGVNENPVAGATLHKLVSGAINNVPKENCLTTAVLSLSEKLANDGTPKKFIAISVGQGGAPIEELMKGASSGYYANRFLAGINRLKAIADSENKTIGVFSIVWMQGESNGSTPTSEYKTKLQQLRNDMVSDIATVFEQTTIPSFLMYGSFSRLFFDYDPQIAMQELAAENNSMFMSNPIYNIPAYRYGHLSSNGCVWFGEYIAKSLYALSHNEEPHIMRIMGAYFINDTTIVVKIDTPVLPIVFDTATWASVQNYGFAVFKDNTEVTISSVENMGNEVIIKLQNDRVEGSTYRLEYVKESARADVRYGNVRDSSKYSPLYKYANDANEVGSNLYGGWEEVEYDPSIDYTVIEEGEYPSLYTVGQYVSENINGTVKYFRCTNQTDYPPYAYVSNRPQNISVGDKFSLYNWLIPFKGNIN